VIDLGAAERELFAGEELAVRRVVVGEGGNVRVEAAEGEERVLVAVSGYGRYRADAFESDGPGQAFSPGQVGVLRSCEWCEVSAEGAEPLVLVEVRAPEPARRT
jgi:mannose-6-phosphate isomerase-like protein (cupin superfamily)